MQNYRNYQGLPATSQISIISYTFDISRTLKIEKSKY